MLVWKISNWQRDPNHANRSQSSKSVGLLLLRMVFIYFCTLCLSIWAIGPVHIFQSLTKHWVKPVVHVSVDKSSLIIFLRIERAVCRLPQRYFWLPVCLLLAQCNWGERNVVQSRDLFKKKIYIYIYDLNNNLSFQRKYTCYSWKSTDHPVNNFHWKNFKSWQNADYLHSIGLWHKYQWGISQNISRWNKNYMGNLGEPTVSPPSSLTLIPLPTLCSPISFSLTVYFNKSFRVPFSLTDSFHSPGSQFLCSRNQCEEQINISKQWVTSPSWFWFFCCLSGSVSALHRIKKPEYDTSQIPVDRWGLTTDVPELYTCMSAPIYTQTHTFMANTFVTLMGCICLGRLPQTKVPEEQSQINTVFFIFFHCSVVSVTGHDRCQHIFFSTLDGFSP